MHRSLGVAITAAILLAGPIGRLQAQPAPEDPSSTILSLDARFWQAYNSCDTGALGGFFTDDVEFYHDKGGVTLGGEALSDSLKMNLCGGDTRLRREASGDTVHLSLLRKGREIYGAVLAGEHRFYIVEAGKDERLDGQAKFVHLWLLQDGHWRMSRILSYDHGPVPYANTRTTITLADPVMESFVGAYQGSEGGTINVRRADATLLLSAGDGNRAPLTLYPESDAVFFVKERDLTFEFVKNEQAAVIGMQVREGGKVVEKAVRAQ